MVQNRLKALWGLFFCAFFKFICEKSCPRLDIGRRWLETQKFSNASVIDLQKKETARASMRKMVKHFLKKYKYPPVEYDTAISTVISQCEM